MTEKRKNMKKILESIKDFLMDDTYDAMFLVINDKDKAVNLRAAISMHRLRHDLDFTTSVDVGGVWIMKNPNNIKEVMYAEGIEELL